MLVPCYLEFRHAHQTLTLLKISLNVPAKLERDALRKQQITHENFKQFSRRVKKTLRNINPKMMDRTIESMNKKLNLS